MTIFYEFSDPEGNSYTISLVDGESYPIDGIEDRHLRAFFGIYQVTIPDHRENVEVICNRLKFKSDPATYLAICRCEATKTIIGGYILEHYPISKFCLLRYIFRESSYAGKEIGLSLGRSIEFLVNSILISREGKLVKTVLFETAVHPDYTGIANYAPIAKFFSKIEGVWIDTPYLAPISGRVKYLLGAIPVSGNLRENITQKDLHQFLDELYLHNDQSVFDSQFYLDNISSWQRKLEGDHKKITDKIKEFPRLIRPKLELSRVSIALHFIEEGGIDVNWENLKKNKNIYDAVFNSYEKDLFSQRFVEDPPYYTKHVDVQYASIQFSNLISFNSEGREETLILVDENAKPLSPEKLEKKVKVFLNYTVFRKKDRGDSLNDNIVVWEIVLSPMTSFNEYELIQLEKYFAGKQEGFTLNIRYILNSNICKDVFDFAENLIGGDKVLRREVLAGTVQVDTFWLEYMSDVRSERHATVWRQIYQYYNSEPANRKDSKGADKLECIYAENEDFMYILNAFCGITLGIFDFDRMSIEEVNDTLVPLRCTDSYFVILNKGSIACFCEDNDIYSNALKYGIGINPYLIIPNAVLAYNSYLTSAVYEQTSQSDSNFSYRPIYEKSLLKKISGYIKGGIFGKVTKTPDRLSELITRKDHISSFLKNLVPNVYQYETERELYNHGMEKRGIIEKREDLEEYRRELDDDISHLVNERANLLGKLSLILGVISLSQIYQFFDSVKDLFTGNDTSFTKYISLIFTILLLIAFIFFSARNYQIVLIEKGKKKF